ncbi:MAG TPA: helix-turn-helix domain-containing protein [Acidobacteriaceae bacterium]
MLKAFAQENNVGPKFTFLTNHALVLIVLSKNNTMRMREIADEIGITERAVKRIVDELVITGYVKVVKSGRRNVYTLNTVQSLRHPIVKDLCVDELLKLGAPREHLC